ncbi:hypothetical protein GCM10010145_51060 [Streptomyces ruber]|uniref:DUF5133 domain-containing protein n=2 Tax=Streptomyces TaxID=1883 RepID=A0A918EX96_9ACTN|nr:hypothetical protein GCM10010145_51060 [Streptomyces ruber]
MLLPARSEVARHLERYRAWERVMLAAPADRTARGNFEDSGYTLCVLMGERCAREAVEAAEDYLHSGLFTCSREGATGQVQQPGHRSARLRQAGVSRRGPPAGQRFTAGMQQPEGGPIGRARPLAGPARAPSTTEVKP